MIAFPQAKLNLGLNIVERRPDGYHNLETVFYAVPLTDALEVTEMDAGFPSDVPCDLKVSGVPLDGDEQRNLVVRAYTLLSQEFPRLPRLHVHLHKGIPVQAGMGGGSSDATAMLCLLNSHYGLGLTDEQLVSRAARLGADCPFFVRGGAAYAEGIGDRLRPVSLDLSGWHLAVVRPPVAVSTREAFALVQPRRPGRNCLDVVMQPVDNWRHELTNDFEPSVFAQYPQLAAVKQQLYDLGAAYAAMSGSGSALFGLFRQPVELAQRFPGMFTRLLQL